MPTCLELPRLVQALLDLGLSPESIQKVLGQNFLRVVSSVRG
jgi:microsomal dipeptidase-like Zn-dependent dipeptidase